MMRCLTRKNRIMHTGPFIFAVLISAILFISCSDGKTINLVVGPSGITVQPGRTAEMNLEVVFSDSKSPANTADGSTLIPDRQTLKLFSSADLEITLSNPEFKLLSVQPELSKEGIRAKIIIRAGESLLSGESVSVKMNWAGYGTDAAIRVRKNPAARIDFDGVVTDPAAYDVFVNKERRMPAGYIPPDLVRINVPTILVFEEVNHLRRAASDALESMFAAAEAEQGFELSARSGYRSYKTQVMLYEANVSEHGEEYAARFSARPGTSEHQTGLAMDISSEAVNFQLEQSFGKTSEGLWVAENAHRFGFIIRYPEGKEDITGYSYEPWHLRYVGAKLAEEIFGKHLTLEEYFNG